MQNVIDRLKEQLAKGGKERGFRKPIYDAEGALTGYARQHISVVCKDILELCDLGRDQTDPILQAQRKGHTFGASCPPKKNSTESFAAMYADDLFHLIELVERKDKPAPVKS